MAQEIDSASESQAQRLKMAVSPPESEWVPVTADMVAAGVERLEDLAAEILTERQYVVAAVYRAMELERRSHGKGFCLFDHSAQIG